MKKTLHGKRHVRARTKQIEAKRFIKLHMSLQKLPKLAEKVVKLLKRKLSMLPDLFKDALSKI